MLTSCLPHLFIPHVPKKAPWYTKTKWSQKRLEHRLTGLILFLNSCYNTVEIRNTDVWKSFTNPGLFNTDHYRDVKYVTNYVVEKSPFIEVHNITVENKQYALKSFCMKYYSLELINNELNIHLSLTHSS